MSGYLGDLTSIQEHNLVQLRKDVLLAKSEESEEECYFNDTPDDVLLLKFLRACDWDYTKALERVLGALRWRHQTSLQFEDLPEGLLEHGICYLLPEMDNLGHPVLYWHIERVNKIAAWSYQGSETIMRLLLFWLEVSNKIQPAGSEKITVVLDFKHFLCDDVDMKVIQEFGYPKFNQYYPEMLAQCLVINFSEEVQEIWESMTNTFFVRQTSSKVTFLEQPRQLEQFLPLSIISSTLGGQFFEPHHPIQPEQYYPQLQQDQDSRISEDMDNREYELALKNDSTSALSPSSLSSRKRRKSWSTFDSRPNQVEASEKSKIKFIPFTCEPFPTLFLRYPTSSGISRGSFKVTNPNPVSYRFLCKSSVKTIRLTPVSESDILQPQQTCLINVLFDNGQPVGKNYHFAASIHFKSAPCEGDGKMRFFQNRQKPRVDNFILNVKFMASQEQLQSYVQLNKLAMETADAKAKEKEQKEAEQQQLLQPLRSPSLSKSPDLKSKTKFVAIARKFSTSRNIPNPKQETTSSSDVSNTDDVGIQTHLRAEMAELKAQLQRVQDWQHRQHNLIMLLIGLVVIQILLFLW
eukprot:Lithocolla_globosa_v1_NODE_321_length_4507_cov_50.556877.p1 type:complete len:578 gc:universal NODE_321_length_4507_cov_50.556877:1888-155(-)